MISPTCRFEIKDYPSWTQWYVSYSRFVQICATIHPESGTSKNQDKCHQLRNAIKYFNKAAKCKFVSGKEVSFNKGGTASKSNYNPVRQYNSSKPDKYRIDFFILAHASGGLTNALMFIRVKICKIFLLMKIFGVSQPHKRQLSMQ